jgi:hypothetical protein
LVVTEAATWAGGKRRKIERKREGRIMVGTMNQAQGHGGKQGGLKKDR